MASQSSVSSAPKLGEFSFFIIVILQVSWLLKVVFQVPLNPLKQAGNKNIILSMEVCYQSEVDGFWWYMGMEVQFVQKWKEVQGFLHKWRLTFWMKW